MKIPTYDTPQVEDRALPGVRQSSVASPSLFGARAEQISQLGQSITSAGKTATDIATDMQERENADMIFRAETALKDDYLKFEQQAHSRKGIHANGVTAEAEEFFAEQEKKHSQLLQNDRQRQLFGNSLTRLRQSSMGQFARYEAQEGDRALDSSTQSTIVGTINLAAADAANGLIVPSGEKAGGVTVTKDADGNEVATAPGVTVGNNPIDGYTRDIKNRVAVLAGLRGMGKAEQSELESKYISDMHVQVMQNMVDTNATGAREYYAKYKDEVLGSQRDSVEQALRVGGLRETAQGAADEVFAKGMSEQEALAHARENYTGEEEAAVIGEIKMRFGEVTQMRERGQKQLADQAWHVYAQTGSLKNVPSSVIAGMDGRDVEALRAHAANKAAGVVTKTDPGTYYDLRLLASEDPNTFRKADLRKYINALSPSDFQEFVKLQTSPEKLADAATLTQQINNTWGSRDKTKTGAFSKAVTDAVAVEQTRKGKPLDYRERQEIIDRMLIQGEVDGSDWWDDSKTFYEVAGTPDAAKFEPRPNDAQREGIIKRFQQKNNGKKPTEDQINQIFRVNKGF